jgi:hypothetical protein
MMDDTRPYHFDFTVFGLTRDQAEKLLDVIINFASNHDIAGGFTEGEDGENVQEAA